MVGFVYRKRHGRSPLCTPSEPFPNNLLIKTEGRLQLGPAWINSYTLTDQVKINLFLYIHTKKKWSNQYSYRVYIYYILYIHT